MGRAPLRRRAGGASAAKRWPGRARGSRPLRTGTPSPCGSRCPRRSGRTPLRPPLRPRRWVRLGESIGRQLDRGRPDPPSACSHQRLAVIVAECGLDQLHSLPRPQDACGDSQRRDWHRAQDLAGDSPDLELGRIVEQLDLAPKKSSGRAGVLGAGVPGTAGQLSRRVAVAVALVEGFGHAPSSGAIPPKALLRGRCAQQLGAEVLGPDEGTGVAFERTDPEADADLGGSAEDVRPVPGECIQAEDRVHVAEGAGPLSDVLAAAQQWVAEALHPESEVAARRHSD